MKGYFSQDKHKHFFMHQSFSSVTGSQHNATNTPKSLAIFDTCITVNNSSTAESHAS